MQIKRMTIRFKLLLVVGCAFLSGGLLAKLAPMESGGLSQAVKKEPKTVAKATKSVTSSGKEPAQPVVELSYPEEVNQEIEQGKYTNHLKMHLQLQTDERWKEAAYGIGNSDGNTIGINGCAIASLAMVSSYLDGKDVTPLDVLAWSGNTYFMEGQGTAWSIFAAYAEAKGYVCQELGADITAVEEQLQAGNPVVVSVQPGYFTETGHIMVMSGTDNGTFWINDPNDTAEKGHSKRTYTAAEVMNEAVNFWVFSKPSE